MQYLLIFSLYFFSLLPKLTESSLFNNVKTSITQDAVWVYSNSSTLTHVDNRYTPIFYDENIKSAMNLTQPTESGLKGVLYHQDVSSCNNNNSNNNKTTNSSDINEPKLPTGLPKIALINQDQQGGCDTINNILMAQMSGAIGVIMYGKNIKSPDNDVSTMIPMGTNITIVVYFIDVNIGEDLMEKVKQFQNTPASLLTPSMAVKSFVRVILLPASSGGINPWEITLLIVSILLVTSFFASVIMHWLIWKKQKRREYLIEQGIIPTPVEMLPMGKHIIDKSKLEELFPATTVSSDQDASQNDALTCVICLEGITTGMQIRRLPCKHEFHCHCIDPWLSSKCAECPLCKYDCYQMQISDKADSK